MAATDLEFPVYFRHRRLLHVFVVDAINYWEAIRKTREYAAVKGTRPDGAILARVK